MIQCKLTGKEGKGVKSHIIPKSFYNIDPNEPLPTKLITNTEGKYPKRIPVGIYDTGILIEEGERKFSAWDDYATELLLDGKEAFEPLQQGTKLAGYQLQEYRYDLLKLFCLSLLWRAAVTSHDMFRKVNLGPHEDIIKDALLASDPSDEEWYSVCLAKWSDFDNGLGMMDPFRERYDGINYYRFYIEGYIIYFKVDKAKTPRALRNAQLKPDAPLIVVARELKKSKEYPIMVNMAKNHG